MKHTGRDVAWQPDRFHADIDNYQVIIEKRKYDNFVHVEDDQTWSWAISYYGAVLSSGYGKTPEKAKQEAFEHVPFWSSEEELE